MPLLIRVPLQFRRRRETQVFAAAADFYETMRTRRTVRDFSSDPVPRRVIEDCIRAAGTAPNGANLQPWQFVVFQVNASANADGKLRRTYYPKESVGIAIGFLIVALHAAGVVTLTHTPSPMNFLNGILGRPAAEKPFLLLVAGFPAEGVQVPAISRKPLEQIATFL